MKLHRSVFLALFAAGVLAASIQPLSAQTNTRYVAEGVVPTPIEVARAMAGSQFKPRAKMRGLAVPAGAAPSAATEPNTMVAIASNSPMPTPSQSGSVVAAPQVAATLASAPQNAGVLAIAIPFSFDSARLAQTANPVLDNVAEGIKLLGAGTPVLIEGHTDASGQSAYNLRLSKQRAQSVKRYLVAQHGISPRSLRTLGKGEHEPLSGMTPTARENRRVQFQIG
jgi:outer membrane protein OmpA-like peptidoglycan-associated protein